MKKPFQQLRIDAEGGSVLLEYAIATLVIMLIWYSIDGAGKWTNSLYMLPTVDPVSKKWIFYDASVYGALPASYVASGYITVSGPGTDTFLVLQDGLIPSPELPDGPAAGAPQTAGIGVRTATTVDYKTYGLLGDNLRARVNRTIQGIASPVP
jgi:hypothetical protein